MRSDRSGVVLADTSTEGRSSDEPGQQAEHDCIVAAPRRLLLWPAAGDATAGPSVVPRHATDDARGVGGSRVTGR